MPNPLKQLPWEACPLTPSRDREVEAYLKREAGSVPGWSRYFWASPWFAKAMIRVGIENGLLMRLDFDLVNLTALVVSQENSCRYCYAVARAMVRMLGLNEARMQDLERRLGNVELDPRTAAALHFARIVNRGHPLDGGAERAALQRTGFDDDEIRELAYVTVITGFMNRLSTAAALPPQRWESAPDNPAIRLLRPLIALLLRRLMKHGTPDAYVVPPSVLAPTLIAVYQGSPIARILSESLADLWAAEGLNRRSKLLIIATIAQGVDCAICRREVELLAIEEGIETATLNAIISHLDDPSLNDQDRALLIFARATLWYEPQKLQQLSRTLIAKIGERQFLEALGVATFANAYTRLTATMIPTG